jgi:ankyrin repeat protein
MHSSPAILSRLINHPQIDVNALTDFKMTPLHIAVQSSKYENCELILNAGVCIDFKDEEGNTALHYAA